MPLYPVFSPMTYELRGLFNLTSVPKGTVVHIPMFEELSNKQLSNISPHDISSQALIFYVLLSSTRPKMDYFITGLLPATHETLNCMRRHPDWKDLP